MCHYKNYQLILWSKLPGDSEDSGRDCDGRWPGFDCLTGFFAGFLFGCLFLGCCFGFCWGLDCLRAGPSIDSLDDELDEEEPFAWFAKLIKKNYKF